jgi:lactoylglutathione lyase
MRIDHVAIWTRDIEAMRSFYMKYFNCISSNKYYNPTKGFTSYFLEFDSGCRIELMHCPAINRGARNELFGYIHIAISLGSRESVDSFTKQIGNEGYTIASQPRVTGDSFYESVILDRRETGLS